MKEELAAYPLFNQCIRFGTSAGCSEAEPICGQRLVDEEDCQYAPSPPFEPTSQPVMFPTTTDQSPMYPVATRYDLGPFSILGIEVTFGWKRDHPGKYPLP